MQCARTRINLCLYAGDRNEITVRVLEDGYPMDLTGAQVNAQVRGAPSDAQPALTGTVTAVDESQGTYTIGFDGGEVRALLAGADTWRGVWDLDILPAGDTDGQSMTVAVGSVVAEMDVTRDWPAVLA